jgi:hypothetical protein
VNGNNEGFGWEDKVDPAEKPRPIVPEGPAMFTVLDWKRDRGNCGKYGTQNVAKIKMLVSTMVEGDNTEAEIEENIWLVQDLKWKFLQFFTAIGQRKHGDKGEFVANWSKIKGEVGRCVINHREFDKRDGSKGIAHNIKEFLAPEGQEDDLKFD